MQKKCPTEVFLQICNATYELIQMNIQVKNICDYFQYLKFENYNINNQEICIYL